MKTTCNNTIADNHALARIKITRLILPGYIRKDFIDPSDQDINNFIQEAKKTFPQLNHHPIELQKEVFFAAIPPVYPPLKPCPFCGSNILIILSEPSPDKTITWHTLLHPPESFCSVSMLNSNKELLLNQWETRKI